MKRQVCNSSHQGGRVWFHNTAVAAFSNDRETIICQRGINEQESLQETIGEMCVLVFMCVCLFVVPYSIFKTDIVI